MQEHLLWRRGDNLGSRFGTMDRPGEIIRRKREAKGWSQDKLGTEVGISQEAVVKIENGKTRKSKYFPNIAQVLDIPLNDIDASLAAAPRTKQVAADDTRPPANFPIRGSVEGGPGQIIISNDPVDYVERPPQLAQAGDAYGLLITGTSMEPEYRPGDTAYVHPHLPIVGNEVYVFYAESDGEARATIKHLRKATPDKWFVSQHNPPDGGPKDFVLLRREWQTAHRVLGRFRPR